MIKWKLIVKYQTGIYRVKNGVEYLTESINSDPHLIFLIFISMKSKAFRFLKMVLPLVQYL